MVYTLALATAGNNATSSSSSNTEVELFTIAPGARSVALQAMMIIGKAAAPTSMSAIAIRIIKWSSASTGGTSITPRPKDPGMRAATQTVGSGGGITPGTGRTNHMVFGCSSGGPGGWVAANPNSVLLSEGGAGESIDALDLGTTLAMNFEWSAETVE